MTKSITLIKASGVIFPDIFKPTSYEEAIQISVIAAPQHPSNSNRQVQVKPAYNDHQTKDFLSFWSATGCLLVTSKYYGIQPATIGIHGSVCCIPNTILKIR
jgi:hypothetical protein